MTRAEITHNQRPVINGLSVALVCQIAMTVLCACGSDSGESNDRRTRAAVPPPPGAAAVGSGQSSNAAATTQASGTIATKAPSDGLRVTDLTLEIVEDAGPQTIALAASEPRDDEQPKFVVVSVPKHGQLTMLNDRLGKVWYNPARHANGTETLDFNVAMPDGTSVNARLEITITSVEDPPVAVADAAATTAGVAVTIAAAANDTDGDAGHQEALKITAATVGAAVGSVSISGDGRSVVFTPLVTVTGRQTIVYTITDPSGKTAQGQINVNVAAPNTPLAANADTASTAEDTAVTIPVLANDTGALQTEMTVTGFSVMPSHGTVAVSADGKQVVYTPAADYTGSDTFTYRSKDNGTDTSSAAVTVTVTPVNDAPAAAADSYTVAAGGTVALSVLGNDRDPDGDSLSVTARTAPTAGTVTAISETAGTYTFDAAGLTAGTVVTFTYTTADPAGLVSTATVTISVQ